MKLLQRRPIGVKLSLIFSLAFLFFTSCEEEGAEYVSDLDTTVTRYDEDFDFTTVRTYVMPDTVVHIPEPESESTSRDEFDAAILHRIQQNFADLGYQRLEENEEGSEQPDVVVTVSLVENDVYALYPYPGSWYGYWGWYDWGYWGYPWIGDGYYPYYPYYWGSYAYSTGTLAVDMLTPVESEEESSIPVVWNGLFNGIISYSLDERMMTGIDQMFSQSPYLSVNVND